MDNKKNLKDLDLAFIDTETTGVLPSHELIEMAVMRVSAYNFSVLEEWEAKIKPQHLDNAMPEALKINHYNDEEWKNALSEESVLKTFLQKTQNAMLVGHNITFDWYYIHKGLAKYGLAPTFWYKSLDTFTLAWNKLRNDPRIKSLSMEELCKYFGIEQEMAHRALSDVKTTYKVFLKLIQL